MTEIADMTGPAGDAHWPQVGAEMRQRRINKAMSLGDFADCMYYPARYLYRVETGQQSMTPAVAKAADRVLQTGGVLARRVASPDLPTSGEGAPDPTGIADCPYPGLAAFEPHQGKWFFGREKDIQDLINRLDARLAGPEAEPLVVVAPSGTGTSSLLAAGLIPALHRGALPGSETWTVVRSIPGANPLATLAADVAAQTEGGPADMDEVAANPRRFADFLINRMTDGATLVLVVDELERAFIECQDDAAKEEFVNALCVAARNANAEVLVVIGVRADYFGECRTYPSLARALQDTVQCEPMNRGQLREIISCPAEATGRRVDPELVNLLLDDLGVNGDLEDKKAALDPGALAWLSQALRVTWQHSSDPNRLTANDYRAVGRIAEAIAIHAEDVYQLNEPDQEIIKQVLLGLIQVGNQARDVRRWMPRNKLLEDMPGDARNEQVLEILGRARLLTFGTHGDADNGNAQNAEITHEALLQSWPRLRGWINADRDWWPVRQSLSANAMAWDLEGRKPRDPSCLLYAGSRLKNAQEWTNKPQYEDQLSETERKFLEVSKQREERKQRAERRRARLRKSSVPVTICLVIVSIVLGYWSYENNRLATANKLVGTFRSLIGKQPDAAMLAAVEAFRLKQVPETRGALLSAQDHFFVGRLAGPDNGVIRSVIHSVKFSHDGRILVTAGDNGAVQLWDVADRRLLGGLETHSDAIFDAEFSPDDKIVATAGKNGAVLWDVTIPQLTPQPLRARTAGTNRDLRAATFSHDGRILATAGKDGITLLWDVDSRREIVSLPGHTGPVRAVRFSPDDRILATVSEDGTARLWDVTSYQPITSLLGHIGHVNAVAFSPTAPILVTVGADTTARLWDMNTHQQVGTLTGHTGPVNTAAFSPDGRLLVTGSDDRTARLWDVASPIGTSIGAFRGTSTVTGVAFRSDGRTVATAGMDGVARLWDTGGPILIPSPPAIGYDLLFSPDGKNLVTSGEDGTVRIWDMANRRQIDKLSGHNGAIRAMAFSPDGRILATAGTDGTARLWDVVTRRLIGPPLTGHPRGVNGVAFSRDGDMLATVGDDSTVLLWDATTRQRIGQPLTDRANNVVRAVAFSPDGRTLATAGDGSVVQLWDVTTLQTTGPPLARSRGAINKLVFSPDGRLLATASDSPSASENATVRIWDVATREVIAELTGHTGNVQTVAFSRDGSTLVTASDEGTAKLWSVGTYQLIATLTGHADVVYGAAFSPDGTLLATAGGDRTVRLWDLNVNRVTDRICDIIGTVSRAQWTQIIPDLPYQPTCPEAR